jgi:hypothetical protein
MPEEEISEAHRKYWFAFSIVLIIAGIAFYWAWGIMFGTWDLFKTTSLGAYVLTVLLLGFGIIGALLTRKKK